MDINLTYMIDLKLINKVKLPEDNELKIYLWNYWLNIALLEHASIWAFSKLSLQLLWLWAPAKLIEDCYKAGIDEINHAKITFTLASHYLWRNMAPWELKWLLWSKISKVSYKTLAIESLIYWYIWEWISAKFLKHSSKISKDNNLNKIYNSIADDELRHSILWKEILTWWLKKEKEISKNWIKNKLYKILKYSQLLESYFDIVSESKLCKKHLKINTSNYWIIDYKSEILIKKEMMKFYLNEIRTLVNI